MSDQDVFEVENKGTVDNPEPNSEPTVSAESPKVPEGLEELVGEGKKYSSVEDALKSIPHAQTHISNLEQEMQELREELNKRLNAEELVNRVTASNKDGETHQSEVDPEAIAQLVNDTVHKIDQEKVQKTNLEEVNKRMRETYGEKAGEQLKAKASELGMDVDSLKSMAAQSPKAFYNLVGLESGTNRAESPDFKSSVSQERAGVNNGTGPKFGTYAYYQQLRKEDPRRYYTNETQRQMHQHAKELGEQFYE